MSTDIDYNGTTNLTYLIPSRKISYYTNLQNTLRSYFLKNYSDGNYFVSLLTRREFMDNIDRFVNIIILNYNSVKSEKDLIQMSIMIKYIETILSNVISEKLILMRKYEIFTNLVNHIKRQIDQILILMVEHNISKYFEEITNSIVDCENMEQILDKTLMKIKHSIN